MVGGNRLTEGQANNFNLPPPRPQLQMLCGIFPRHIIEFLSMRNLAAVPENYGALARSHEDITILFMDIVGFTSMSKEVQPALVMTFLNQ